MRATSKTWIASIRTFPGLVGAIFFVGLLLTMGAVIWSFIQEGAYRPLPSPPVYGQLPEFTLTNQAGRQVTLASLRGTVWVADIVFTRCAGPCPILSAHMSRLHSFWSGNAKVKLVTLTADPDNDTPQVLQRYGERYGSKGHQWLFLTGDKRQIQNLAIKGFKLALEENTGGEPQAGEDLFIHSTKFVLVDQAGRVRGYYEGTEAASHEKLMQDVHQVLREG